MASNKNRDISDWQPQGDRAAWMRGNIFGVVMMGVALVAGVAIKFQDSIAFPVAAKEVSQPTCADTPDSARTLPSCRAIYGALQP